MKGFRFGLALPESSIKYGGNPHPDPLPGYGARGKAGKSVVYWGFGFSFVPVAIAILLASAQTALPMTLQERRDYRNKLVQILPDVPAFDEWLKKTDELPPDFDALPRHNGLPDPLKFFDGRAVTTPKDWDARRAEILDLFQKYAWGSIPPHPALAHADVQETKNSGYRSLAVVLHVGPDGKGIMHVTLIIPDGKGPFPVLMGPGLIGGFGNSAPTILRRGYITASYAGNDFTDDSRAIGSLYPQFDFGTLPRRAWAASTVLDYLQTLPEADMQRVAIFGYSRDGKQAAIAAALDTRIKAVLAGSTGVGGLLPYRLAGERNQAEGIESTTRMFPDWFSPRLRFFCGREDRLPVDGNLLLAAIAPRPCLMVSGYNDEVSNDWGDEQSQHSALKVYQLLGAADKLGIYRVPGFHGANDMEVCLDFLDMQFGRSPRTWTSQFYFPWNWEQWKQESGESVDLATYPEHRADEPANADPAKVRASVQWMLGPAPPTMPIPRGGFRGGFGNRTRAGSTTGPTTAPAILGNPGQTAPDVINWVIQRSEGGSQEFGWFADAYAKTATRPFTFGYNVRGDLYYPKNAPPGKKLPTVIWLHSFSYPLGYMWVYRRDLHPVLALVKAGYAVLAYDQSGFGSRMKEAGPFYDRFPHWSQMGQLVTDASAAVDALRKDSLVDPDHVYLFGYSLGGTVAIYTAALDSHVSGVVSICGFTPMRTDTPDKGDGGIARYAIERQLIPRLGFFIGHESQIPYDYADLLGAIAPRPVLVVQPQLDRDATPGDVHDAVESARKIYSAQNAENNLALKEPWDYNRLPTSLENDVIDWMKQNMK
jgi:pimeloyl-ACP methyl ester carboxylesterase